MKTVTKYYQFVVAGLVAALICGCASTNYVGETYSPTMRVDIFFSAGEIARSHKVMGQAQTKGSEYLTFELLEQQLVKDAMAKGADAIVIEGMDTVITGSYSSTSGQQTEKPRYVATLNGEIKNVGGTEHYTEMTRTIQTRDHILTAKLIKYTD